MSLSQNVLFGFRALASARPSTLTAALYRQIQVDYNVTIQKMAGPKSFPSL